MPYRVSDLPLFVKLRAMGPQLSYLARTLRLIYAAAPRQTVAWFILLSTQGLLPVALVYLSRLLVDSLVAAMASGGSWEKVQPALIEAALIAGILLLTEFLQGATEWVRTSQSESIQDYVLNLVHAKSIAVDFAFYESADYYDRLHRVVSEAVSHPLSLLQSTGSLFQSGLTLLGMLAVIIPYGVWLPFVLLASALPSLYIVFRFNQRYHEWWKKTTPDRRWAEYYNVMLTNSNAAAELRLFDLGSHFQSAYQGLRRRLRKERLGLLKDQSLARLGAGVISMVISGATMAWFVWQALQRAVSLGELALFYQVFSVGQSLMRSLLGNLGQIYSSSLFLGNLFDFLDLRSQVLDPSSPLQTPTDLKQGIRFRNVTFRYPGSKRPALEDFNLTLPAGRIVALVGANGAGKSTLVKLLCRYYDPESGSIEIDGVNIRDVRIVDLRRMITVLFQIPVPYHATVGQNIAIADLPAAPDASKIDAAARRAGAAEFIERLPQGYDTLLGKWFANGMELSAGEWQRVALARAYVRQGKIMILDEPTSFMDSWAEADWFERFRALARDRTAIVITHRFTIAMRTDVIFVIHEGRIIESGSHSELLALGGRYARSWEAQMRAVPDLSV